MRGFFEIGVYQPKTAENIGTLWRSAYQLGAAGIFTIGRRYRHQVSDTCKSPRHIPLRHYETWEQFCLSRPDAARVVGIEMGGRSLSDFTHPSQAIYLLGSEDGGLPPGIQRACQVVVELEAVGPASYNVAVAGSLVMYHRFLTTNYRVQRIIQDQTPMIRRTP